MLSTLSILLLLLLLTEADVQLSLFKAVAVWLLMLRAPSCSFALPLSYLQRPGLGAPIPFHVFPLRPQSSLQESKNVFNSSWWMPLSSNI